MLTNDDLIIMLNTLRQHDSKKVKDRIIQNFMGIGCSIALSYHASTKVEADELKSVALLAIVKSVNRLHSLKHDNVHGYITSYIHNDLRRFLEKQNKVKLQQVDSFDKADKNRSLSELRDALDFIIHNDREHEIVNLRLKGKTRKDIAEIMGLNVKTVTTSLKKLYERYRRVS